MSRKLDHVAIAAWKIEDVLPIYKELGMAVERIEEVPGQGVRVAFLPAGECRLEILEPLGGPGPIRGFLEKRGPGLHHLAFETREIEADLDRLAQAGVRTLSDKPRAGSRGARVCFLHPKSAGGVLLELVEPEGPLLAPRD